MNFCLLCVLLLFRLIECQVINLDCGIAESLCPSVHHHIVLRCETTNRYLVWHINNQGQNIEFTSSNNINETKTSTNGLFLATLVVNIENAPMISTLRFNSSLVSLGTVIECIDNAANSGGIRQCQTMLAEPSGIPTNLTLQQQQQDSSTITLSWSTPLTTKSSLINYYIIKVINDSTNNTWTTNLTEITINGLKKGVIYQVIVKAVKCYGSLLGNESLILVQLTNDPSPSASFISTQSTVVLSTSSFTLYSQTMTSLSYSSPITSITGLSTSTVISTETNKEVQTTLIPRSTTVSTQETTNPTINISDEPDSILWTMLIISGTIGAFITLFLLSIVTLSVSIICLLRKAKRTPPIEGVIQTSSPPPPLTFSQEVTHSTEPMLDITLCKNPCFKDSYQVEDYYPVILNVPKLAIGNSRTELV